MRKNTILNQLMQLFSRYDFKRCVNHHLGDKYVKKYDCWQQFITLLYTQGKGLHSLRDIISSLNNHQSQWYHLGLNGIARSTLSDAMNHRSSDIYEDFFYIFLEKCKKLSPNHKFRFKNPLYSMDSTIVSLCLSMFPWAKYRRRKGALKIHTLLDHKGCLPSFITMTDGKCHDINVVRDEKYNFPVFEPDSILAIDKGYIDYKWLYSLEKQQVFFVTRAKDNIKYKVTGQHEANKKKGIISDESIRLTNYYHKNYYPENLRLIEYYDKETDKYLCFLTNNFKLAASTIAAIYKARWTIELFFKWIKQNLKIKSFLGTSENAVMSQVWVAMIYYLLLAFIKFQTKYSFSMLELSRTIRDLILQPVNLIEILRIKYDKFYSKIKPKDIQLSFL